jgi:hypothetical protein
MKKQVLKALLILIVVGGDVAFYSQPAQIPHSQQLSSHTSADQQNAQSGVCTTCGNNVGAVTSFVYNNSSLTYEALVNNYSDSPEVKKLIRSAKNKISGNGKYSLRSKSTGYCYRYVKWALMDGGLAMDSNGRPYKIPGANPKTAGPALKSQGFTNLLETPYANNIRSAYDAPVGAILIYSGGTYGHAEIRTEEGFISDYFNKRARTGDEKEGRGSLTSGKYRKLVGVYVKLNLEKDSQ